MSDLSKQFHRRMGVLDALMNLSEGVTLTPVEAARARREARGFIERSDLGYVVVDRTRASEALRTFAIEALDLVPLESTPDRELYAPRQTQRRLRDPNATVPDRRAPRADR